MFHVLSLVLVLKQQFIKFSFIELVNGKSQIKIKNRSYYIYNDSINLKNFVRNSLKVDKNVTKGSIFTTLGAPQLKKLIILNVFTA